MLLDTSPTPMQVPGSQPVATTQIGVAISRSEVVVVGVHGTKDDWTVERFACLPVTGGNLFDGEAMAAPDKVGKAMAAAWRMSGLPVEGNVVVALDGEPVTMTRRLDDEKVMKSLVLGLEASAAKSLHNAEPGRPTIAAPRKFTASIRAMFDTQFVNVTNLIPAGYAAAQVVPFAGKATRVVIIADGDRCTATLLNGDRVDVVRSKDGAGFGAQVQAFLEGAAPAANMPAGVAAHIVQTAQMVAVAAEEAPSRILLAGPAASIVGLSERIGEALQTPVDIVDPVREHLPESALTAKQQKAVAPRLVAAVGAAVYGLTGGRANLL